MAVPELHGLALNETNTLLRKHAHVKRGSNQVGKRKEDTGPHNTIGALEAFELPAVTSTMTSMCDVSCDVIRFTRDRITT